MGGDKKAQSAVSFSIGDIDGEEPASSSDEEEFDENPSLTNMDKKKFSQMELQLTFERYARNHSGTVDVH
eukprot:CAMPEP_0114575618 /NCGR_PEP_ID=MMETSP0125-20121206/474_1 /TAXON_ID=485358 ORGANISM="Aristerostoma sp., Strain ATCC 50986" /NCGR_SAMPLE_ID=MMETSP0125 /ASSEMBLY_ACC=CAM_ASM_000245 /LENGTH=69 /DNA_ID=CAMNT_0001763501 /DNA_START=3033 /DNA_END=3242 /DNA_ORIENTATION=+